jgi:hypothetical protein
MKSYLALLLALSIWAGVLTANTSHLRTSDKSHIAGIHNFPGVQMELARAPEEVTDLLLPVDSEQGKMNRETLRQQQYLDCIFIPLYWALFWFAFGGPLLSSGATAGRVLGLLVRVSITVAAIADYMEDIAIVSVLYPTYQGCLWPFKFGFPKWLFFFLALGFSAPFLWHYPKLGDFAAPSLRWDRPVARIIGALFFSGSVLGIVGTIGTFYNKGEMLVLGFLLTFGALGLLLAWFLGKSLPQPAMQNK